MDIADWRQDGCVKFLDVRLRYNVVFQPWVSAQSAILIEVSERSLRLDPELAPGSLRKRRLSVAWRQERGGELHRPLVLSGVDLDVPARAKVALCGRTGCGKSTLLKLMSRVRARARHSKARCGARGERREGRRLPSARGLAAGLLFTPPLRGTGLALSAHWRHAASLPACVRCTSRTRVAASGWTACP